MDLFAGKTSPRSSSAFVEQGIQALKDNVVEPFHHHVVKPLSDTDIGRKVIEFHQDAQMKVGLALQLNQAFRNQMGLGAAGDPLPALSALGAVYEAAPKGIRRTCRAMGGNPAFCQDLGDGVHGWLYAVPILRAARPGMVANGVKASRSFKALNVEVGKGAFIIERLEASGFKGNRGYELRNPNYQYARNTVRIINNRTYSGHALHQMQNRGIMPSVVESAIKTGKVFKSREGTIGYYDSINKIRVITNSSTGKVVTVIRGNL